MYKIFNLRMFWLKDLLYIFVKINLYILCTLMNINIRKNVFSEKDFFSFLVYEAEDIVVGRYVWNMAIKVIIKDQFMKKDERNECQMNC